jgi:hypothetical protein
MAATFGEGDDKLHRGDVEVGVRGGGGEAGTT